MVSKPPLLLAHRGGAQAGEPNSLEAIRSARSHGAGGVELDVNETLDGTLLVVHDARQGTDRRWLSETPDAELPTVNGIEWSERHLGFAIEAAVADDLIVYLDLKAITATGLRTIVTTWRDLVVSGQVLIACTRADVLAAAREIEPAAITSLLFYDPNLDARSVTAFFRPTYLHPCFDHLADPLRWVSEQYVDRVRVLGCGLVSWSENDPAVVARLRELEFDYVCTDQLSAVADDGISRQR